MIPFDRQFMEIAIDAARSSKGKSHPPPRFRIDGMNLAQGRLEDALELIHAPVAGAANTVMADKC